MSVTEIKALVARGLRGGLTAGQWMGSDEVHKLCELVQLELARDDKLVARALQLTEELADTADSNIRAELYGVLLTLQDCKK